MSKQRFENKSFYDPGRFRFNAQFYQQVSTPDPAGGTTNVIQHILTTKAVKEAFTRRVNEQGQLIVAGGASEMEEVWYFVIRHRKGWRPTKAMNLICENWVYTIRDITDLDIPTNYVKLLCVKMDTDVQFLLGGNGFFYIYANDPGITNNPFVFTNPQLVGITSYSVYSEQLSAFFTADQVIYNANGFELNVPGFELLDDYRLIVFINYIGSL